MRGPNMLKIHLSRLLPGLVALASLMFPLTAGAQAAGNPNEACLMCHADASAKASSGKSIAVDAKVFAGSVHGQMQFKCTDCHSDVSADKLPHEPSLKPADCASCHEAQVKDYQWSAHAQGRVAGSSAAATCSDCHGKHNIAKSGDAKSGTAFVNVEATCGSCHGNDQMAKEHRVPGGNVQKAFHDGIHSKAIHAKGANTKAPTCIGCHGAHRIQSKAEGNSASNRQNVAGMCGSCHQQEVSRFSASMHGTVRQAGNSAAPTCTDCHSAHSIRQHASSTFQADVMKECGGCHADFIKSYRDTYHGQVTEMGYTRIATCSSCHGAHEVLPASNPKSMISPENRTSTCRSCHPGATANFAAFKPHGNAHDRAGDPILYYTRLFMVWLLIGVFSFFGLHTLLWMLRELREVRERRRGR